MANTDGERNNYTTLEIGCLTSYTQDKRGTFTRHPAQTSKYHQTLTNFMKQEVVEINIEVQSIQFDF